MKQLRADDQVPGWCVSVKIHKLFKRNATIGKGPVMPHSLLPLSLWLIKLKGLII